MSRKSFKHLIPEKRYRIIKPFMDYDGKAYQTGDIYTFMRSDFLPYEDGLTLQFKQGNTMVAIRLQWRGQSQAEIIENLEDYFLRADERKNTAARLNLDPRS